MAKKNEIIFYSLLTLSLVFFNQCKSKKNNFKEDINKQDSIIGLDSNNTIKQDVSSLIEEVLSVIIIEELQSSSYNIFVLNEFQESWMYILPNVFENEIEYKKYSSSQKDTLNYKFKVDDFLIKYYKLVDVRDRQDFIINKKDRDVLISLSYPYIYKNYASIEVRVYVSKDRGVTLFYLLQKDKFWKKYYKEYIVIQ